MCEDNYTNVFLDSGVSNNNTTTQNQNTGGPTPSMEIADLIVQIANIQGTNRNNLQHIYNQLYEIYAAENRHSYSTISYAIQESMIRDTAFISNLQVNMEALLQLVERNISSEEMNPNIGASFKKLYDHVMLECNRMGYISKINGDLKKQQAIVETQVNSAVQDLKKLYADLIGIISIFVAIFALITVNANIAFKLTTTNMNEIFWGIIFMNVFVVICILALLGGVRILIINKLTKAE